MTISELVSLFGSSSSAVRASAVSLSAAQLPAAQLPAVRAKPAVEQQDQAKALDLELRKGLPAVRIDGELVRVSRARNVIGRVMAFYLDEMFESGKYAELGYSCLAQYADRRLGMEPRRARELCQAGRVLMERPLVDQALDRSGLSRW